MKDNSNTQIIEVCEPSMPTRSLLEGYLSRAKAPTGGLDVKRELLEDVPLNRGTLPPL